MHVAAVTRSSTGFHWISNLIMKFYCNTNLDVGTMFSRFLTIRDLENISFFIMARIYLISKTIVSLLSYWQIAIICMVDKACIRYKHNPYPDLMLTSSHFFYFFSSESTVQ